MKTTQVLDLIAWIIYGGVMAYIVYRIAIDFKKMMSLKKDIKTLNNIVNKYKNVREDV